MSASAGRPSAGTGWIVTARRLLRRSRPRFWLYLAGPVLVGLAWGAGTFEQLLSPITLALFGYFLLPANLYLYGVNDVFDAPIDRANPKKADREIRYRGRDVTPWAVVVSVGLGLAVVPFLPPKATPYLVGFLLLGGAYSAPPCRFKTRPPLDSLSNGLYVLPGGVAYVTLAGTHPPLLVLVAAWLWTMAMHTFSAIPDIEPDRQAGIQTTATVLGKGGTLLYCGACWLLAATVFAIVDWRAGVALGVYPLAVVVIALRAVPIERAYWWYPAINTVVGAAFTLAGLWRFSGG